jgi:hypothetical protein
MSDDAPAEPVTVLDRLLAAGINPDRAVEHLRAGRVSVDGTIVTDPEAPAPKPVRVVLVAV